MYPRQLTQQGLLVLKPLEKSEHGSYVEEMWKNFHRDGGSKSSRNWWWYIYSGRVLVGLVGGDPGLSSSENL